MVLNSLRRVCSTEFSVVRYLKHSFKCMVKYGLCQPIPSNKKWCIRGVFHLIFQHRKSVISNTGGNVSYQIQTLKEWYINTRKRVSYDIQTQKEWYIKREKEFFFLSYQNTERVLYHTRETVFVMIFKHRESDYITHQNECFIWFSNTKKC